MRDRFIPALITLTAGAITCIFDIYHKVDLLTSLKRLLLVLIIFYIIGLIAAAIIRKTMVPKRKTDGASDDQNINQISEQETDNVAENDEN